MSETYDFKLTSQRTPLDLEGGKFRSEIVQRLRSRGRIVSFIVDDETISIAPKQGGKARTYGRESIERMFFYLNDTNEVIEIVANDAQGEYSLMLSEQLSETNADCVNDVYELLVNLSDNLFQGNRLEVRIDENPFFEADEVEEQASDDTEDAYMANLELDEPDFQYPDNSGVANVDAPNATGHSIDMTEPLSKSNGGKMAYTDEELNDLIKGIVAADNKTKGQNKKETVASYDSLLADDTHSPNGSSFSTMAANMIAGGGLDTRQASDERFDRLTQQLTDQYRRNERMTKDLDSAKRKLGETEKQNTSLLSEIAKMNQRIGDLQGAIVEANSRNEESQAEVSRIKGELDAEKSGRQKDNAKYENTISELTAELDEERTKSSRARNRISDLMDSLDSMQESMNLRDETIEMLKGQLDEGNVKLDEANAHIESSNRELASMRKQALAVSEKAKNSMQEFAEKSVAKVAELQDRMDAITEQLGAITEDRDSLRRQIAIMSRNAVATNTRIDNANEALSKATARAMELDDALMSERQHSQELENGLDILRASVDRAESERDDAIESGAKIRKNADDLVALVKSAISQDGIFLTKNDLKAIRERLGDVISSIEASNLPVIEEADEKTQNVIEAYPVPNDDGNVIYVSEEEITDEAQQIIEENADYGLDTQEDSESESIVPSDYDADLPVIDDFDGADDEVDEALDNGSDADDWSMDENIVDDVDSLLTEELHDYDAPTMSEDDDETVTDMFFGQSLGESLDAFESELSGMLDIAINDDGIEVAEDDVDDTVDADDDFTVETVEDDDSSDDENGEGTDDDDDESDDMIGAFIAQGYAGTFDDLDE